MTEPTKTCTRCDQRKPWSDFHAKVKWEDGTMRQPHSRCKQCMLDVNRERPEAQRAYCRKRDERIRRDPVALAQRRADQRSLYARLSADPEWHSARIVQITEAKRRRLGITPDRYRPRYVGRVTVPAAPVAAAIAASGLGPAIIADRAGLDEAAVRRMEKQEVTSPERASLILDAIGVLPASIGL